MVSLIKIYICTKIHNKNLPLNKNIYTKCYIIVTILMCNDFFAYYVLG